MQIRHGRKPDQMNRTRPCPPTRLRSPSKKSPRNPRRRKRKSPQVSEANDGTCPQLHLQLAPQTRRTRVAPASSRQAFLFLSLRRRTTDLEGAPPFAPFAIGGLLRPNTTNSPLFHILFSALSAL